MPIIRPLVFVAMQYNIQLIRPLAFVTMQYNIQFRAVHIQGITNEIADSLSRFKFQTFRKVALKAARYQEQIPTLFFWGGVWWGVGWGEGYGA